ncbi:MULTISPECIES: putative bifunctional diguanylate cyclase/phosphodiesterase [Pseudomonas]|uniref:putative bifunctional diguanylate cyclase/phosphodiesterase n=1 Tax=Pseudomonas TaxID=286 RepID=UPI0004E72387|nr:MULTISPECIES: EAL domain-containing protein [Pseudomonas]KFF42508.1 histidine kinase [Pseudomonas sp. BRG-100]MCK3827754.1 bifunctional diguanylate cyclase/phosphodiesterase [Pseudomonas sp. W2Aug9]MCK3833730.1 bifunctional diguanylate cyclase/phosphodiesterase [Pseudomonas fluorescens]MCK3853590.1 bifunctional diguanylate cyclase/phosphodiesterase [Pseudomonas sp. W2Jun17]MCK3866008.1 bifunctional diguanylate cyclase/phosphodiesterase [Pseudomonas sp. B329]
MLIGSYSTSLVVISLCVAMLASYTALDLAGRIATTKGRAVYLWITGGAAAMGVGIWSMHFIGMLALRLPFALGFDLGITALSLLIAVLSSGFALWLVSQPRLPAWQLAFGALVMGAGIASMHYTGMAAMRMTPGIDYDPTLFGASLLIAVMASGAALWIAFNLRRNTPYVRLARGAAAVVMGVAIVGMHYTGMAAAQFADDSFCGAALTGLSGKGLDNLVLVTSLAVLVIALLTSLLDARLEARTAVLADSLTLANQELTHLALHDMLTGLPNRTLLADRIQQGIQAVYEQGGCFALMFIDLDGFKPVNDAFGHHMGDQLLREVGLRLREDLRSQDTLARIGGDEFVLLVQLTQPDDAMGLAERQVGLINRAFTVAEHELKISASIGIAMFPGNGNNPQELLMNADAAMYHAKGMGKNGYSFFDASMNTNARKQLQLLQDLRNALELGEFRLYYQPKFDAVSGIAVGAEALLRWEHPQQGLLLPAAFIALAEKTGLIIAIGEWVLDEACRQMSLWYAQGYQSWRIAVNLSALQFCHAGLVNSVAAALERHQLPANSLTLEITETTAMSDADASMTVLQQLSDMGVDLSIDDFGTGYSSLMYLKRLPANELKIDRGFVRDLEHDSDDAAIVSAIVALGQALDLRIVAEGVETDAQQNFLTRLGCDSLQGYLLGHPLPADNFMANILAGEDAPAPDKSHQ